jgi:methyl-accepting chemotaxis protein
MAGAALIVSGAVITYFNRNIQTDEMARFYGTVELAAVTLMPYMISAAVAAVTAVGIMLAWPWLKLPAAAAAIEWRLRELGAGDLAARVKVPANNEQMTHLGRELNCAVGELSNTIARWKLMDRAQWDYLEAIRLAAARGDLDEVQRNVELVQRNFEKIAEVHQRLVT